MRLSRLILPSGAVASVAAATTLGVVGVTSQALAAAGCRVTYSVGSQWPGGFTGNVNLTNLGDPMTSWSLTWSFPAGQQVREHRGVGADLHLRRRRGNLR